MVKVTNLKIPGVSQKSMSSTALVWVFSKIVYSNSTLTRCTTAYKLNVLLDRLADLMIN